ncbi:MAG: hypothetical protein ACLP62_03110 [Acidimicrobiales bacterium]
MGGYPLTPPSGADGRSPARCPRRVPPAGGADRQPDLGDGPAPPGPGGPARPADPRPYLEAELDDGTGTVTARWLGRGAIAVGALLTAEGTVLVEHGRNLVLNPITSFLD